MNHLITDPVALSEAHRETLERLLDGAQRGYEIENHAIKSLNEDLLAATEEGFQHYAEKFSKKIRTHQLQLENRWKDIEALTAALAAIPNEEDEEDAPVCPDCDEELVGEDPKYCPFCDKEEGRTA
jgi:rubrerythrin